MNVQSQSPDQQSRSPHPIHRPYPAPTEPWVMRQTWQHLLFMHWSVPIDLLRSLIPQQLEIDTYQGQAWLAVVPFRMCDVYPAGTFAVPWLSAFAELNVRTYVIRDGKPGVWFFSLDAANRLAVRLARTWFHLPYFHADMTCRKVITEANSDEVLYYSQRTHPNAATAELEARYNPIAPSFEAQPGSLEYFLTARYCLYAADPRGQLYRGEIDHAAWPLQLAQAQVQRNTMTRWLGIPLDGAPLLHYVRHIDVVVWGLAAC